MRLILPLLLATTAIASSAQTATPDGQEILVEGERGKKVETSDWRVAESDHVLVYSKGPEARLTRVAYNLEKLHFLLSVLLGRVDQPDDTLKLSVTLIGDAAEFKKLGLRNVRWQEGPYPQGFPAGRYYDPREDGAVLANADLDNMIVLDPGRIGVSPSELVAPQAPVGANPQVSYGQSAHHLGPIAVNQQTIPVTAEGRIYAGYAQHYLLTYFPAAYPRWYLDGFGEIFATMTADEEGMIEYGQPPAGLRQVMDRFRHYPVEDVLNGRYLRKRSRYPWWTPYDAWAMAHLLLFSEEWRAPLRAYLAAVAKGETQEQAAAALGDIDKLQQQIASYEGRKVPFERMTYPAERVTPPLVRRLRQSEASLVQGRLLLGARIELPPEPQPGTDAETAADMRRDRNAAIADRDAWLEGLRRSADRNPRQLDVQLLLAEAECRSGNHAACLAAADNALALAPDNAEALTWKGTAMVGQAMAGPAREKTEKLRAARALIVRANRVDTEATLPLLGYYRSFAAAGQPAPAAAVDGLAKASDSVPAAPTTRLLLGEELARRGDPAGAREVLLPVADGPYESPEKPKAKAVLERLPK